MTSGVKPHRKRKQNELYHHHESPAREIVVVEFLQERPPKSANERLCFKSQHIFVPPRFLLSHSSPVDRGSRSRHHTSVLTQFESLLQVNSHITALEMKACIYENTQRYFRIICDSFVTDVWSTAPRLWTCRQCLHYMYCRGWRPSSLARLTGVCSVSGATGSIFAFHWKPNPQPVDSACFA